VGQKLRFSFYAAIVFVVCLAICSGDALGRTLSANFPTTRPGLIVRDDAGRILLQPGDLPGSFFYQAAGRTHFLGQIMTRRRRAGGGWTVASKTDLPAATATISMQRASHGGVVITFYLSDMEGVTELGFAYHSPVSEHIHGLTERVVDGPDNASWRELGQEVSLDRRGERVRMRLRPTFSMYSPFYITSKGYGIYVDTTWPGFYDLAATEQETVRFSFEGPRLVFHIFPGPTPAELLNQYTALTGRPLLSPKWACLVWRRIEHRNRPQLHSDTHCVETLFSEVAKEAAVLKKLDIPCGVYCMSFAPADVRLLPADSESATRRPPVFQKTATRPGEKNYRLLLRAAPLASGKTLRQANEKGYLAPNSDNVIDLTKPAAVRWTVKQCQKFVDAGVSGFMLDLPEELIPSGRQDVYFSGKTGREVHNLYPVLYARAYYTSLREKLADDFVLITRSGFAGSQRYAVFKGGNTPPTLAGLRSAVISAERVGLIGMPFWGSETGGSGGTAEREILARWLAFSCFTPVMMIDEIESRASRHIAGKRYYDEELVAIFRYFTKLHTLLADYTYGRAKEARLSGAPLVRPLFYHYPGDERCWRRWDEFLYGRDILVAPIWERGRREREVYLPEGEWVNYWNENQKYHGQQTVEMDAPLSRIPVFLREGHSVPVMHNGNAPVPRPPT